MNNFELIDYTDISRKLILIESGKNGYAYKYNGDVIKLLTEIENAIYIDSKNIYNRT